MLIFQENYGDWYWSVYEVPIHIISGQDLNCLKKIGTDLR